MSNEPQMDQPWALDNGAGSQRNRDYRTAFEELQRRLLVFYEMFATAQTSRRRRQTPLAATKMSHLRQTALAGIKVEEFVAQHLDRFCALSFKKPTWGSQDWEIIQRDWRLLADLLLELDKFRNPRRPEIDAAMNPVFQLVWGEVPNGRTGEAAADCEASDDTVPFSAREAFACLIGHNLKSDKVHGSNDDKVHGSNDDKVHASNDDRIHDVLQCIKPAQTTHSVARTRTGKNAPPHKHSVLSQVTLASANITKSAPSRVCGKVRTRTQSQPPEASRRSKRQRPSHREDPDWIVR